MAIGVVLQVTAFQQGFAGGYGSDPDKQTAGLTLSELWLEDQHGPQVELD